jgi:AcrR family transcriptional regulator
MVGVVAGKTGSPAVRELSRRGLETRAALIAAAREQFERKGFVDTRIGDITAAAKTATGSFYTYFAGKQEIFAAVMEEVSEAMLHPQLEHLPQSAQDDVVAAIEAANRAYLDAYRANAGLMAVLEQVSTINDEFREIRRRRGAAFIKRNARSIERLQAEGRADQGVDAEIAARALTGMVSRLAYQAFILEEPMEFEALVSASTRLWINALRLS